MAGNGQRWSKGGPKSGPKRWPGVQISGPPVKNRFFAWFSWISRVLAFLGGPKMDPFLIDFEQKHSKKVGISLKKGGPKMGHFGVPGGSKKGHF